MSGLKSGIVGLHAMPQGQATGLWARHAVRIFPQPKLKAQSSRPSAIPHKIVFRQSHVSACVPILNRDASSGEQRVRTVRTAVVMLHVNSSRLCHTPSHGWWSCGRERTRCLTIELCAIG
eukprot:1987994-Amphidinium_carterae.1